MIREMSVEFIYKKIETSQRRYKRITQNGARSSKPKWLVPRQEALELLKNATPANQVVLE